MKITHHKGRIWRVMSTYRDPNTPYRRNREAVVVAPTAQIALEMVLKARPESEITSCNPVTMFQELDVLSYEEEPVGIVDRLLGREKGTR